MRLTVGIVTCGRPISMHIVLNSLLRQATPVHDLIIVDDSPDLSTGRVVSMFRPVFTKYDVDVQYIHRADKKSMPGARNVIIDNTETDVLAFIDDDVICPVGWASSIIESHENNPEIECIGGPAIHINKKGGELFEITRDRENKNRMNIWGECTWATGYWVPPTPTETDDLDGANMSFKTDIFGDVGGFSTVYEGPSYFEDTDLLTRLRNAGGTILYHPDVLLYHLKDAGNEENNDQTKDRLDYYYWRGRNGAIFRKRLLKNRTSIIISCLRMVLLKTPDNDSGVLGVIFDLNFNLHELMSLTQGCIDGLRSPTDSEF